MSLAVPLPAESILWANGRDRNLADRVSLAVASMTLLGHSSSSSRCFRRRPRQEGELLQCHFGSIDTPTPSVARGLSPECLASLATLWPRADTFGWLVSVVRPVVRQQVRRSANYGPCYLL